MGQSVITRSGNEWRNGDALCKVQVAYVSPGEKGQDAVWQLGEINRHSEEFMQGVASNGDTIAVFEPTRIVHFVVHGDTLWDKGEQQRRTYRIYSNERPVLRYPFAYGDSIGGTFTARGIDEGIDLMVTGSGYSVADGTGLLTDGIDTLRHILRLHLEDCYTEDYGGQTQLHYVRQHYMWNCAGYRYPVQESFHWSIQEGDQLHPVDSVTYLYLPVQQTELAEDIVNDSIRQSVTMADAIRQAQQRGGIAALSSANASLSPDGMSLSLSFSTTEACPLSFIACDIVGNTLGQAHNEDLPAGDHTETISLSRRPVGNALMLNIVSGNESQSMKVYQ